MKCFFGAETEKGECIPRGTWIREPGVLECDDHRDCPGGRCCGAADLTFCSTSECHPGLAHSSIVCRTVKDCGTNDGAVPVCTPEEKLPNGLGTCG